MKSLYVPEDSEKVKRSHVTSEKYCVTTEVKSFVEHHGEHISPKHWGISSQKSDMPFSILVLKEFVCLCSCDVVRHLSMPSGQLESQPGD